MEKWLIVYAITYNPWTRKPIRGRVHGNGLSQLKKTLNTLEKQHAELCALYIDGIKIFG